MSVVRSGTTFQSISRLRYAGYQRQAWVRHVRPPRNETASSVSVRQCHPMNESSPSELIAWRRLHRCDQFNWHPSKFLPVPASPRQSDGTDPGVGLQLVNVVIGPVVVQSRVEGAIQQKEALVNRHQDQAGHVVEVAVLKGRIQFTFAWYGSAWSDGVRQCQLRFQRAASGVYTAENRYAVSRRTICP